MQVKTHLEISTRKNIGKGSTIDGAWGMTYTVLTALAGRKAPLHLVSKWMEDICAGEAELHAEGIVLMDLKPDNVLLDQFDSAVIGDFGESTAMHSTKVFNNDQVGGTANYQLRSRPLFQ